MVSKNVDLLPEVLATLTFLPLGVFMGFIIHFYFINSIASSILFYSEQWPHVVSSVCAVMTGLVFILRRANQSNSRYHFEHFYILMFGMFFVLLGAILLVAVELPYAGIYIIFSGKGVCYIAALSYLNVRVAKSRYRMIKLSLPHWVYLFGVAVGASITGTSTNSTLLFHYDNVIKLTSILIIVMAIVLLCGYLTNELMHRQDKLNYKRSLDNDINRENDQNQIFENKYFFIEEPRSEVILDGLINKKHETDEVKESFSIVLALVGKIIGVMYFYAPFMFLYILGSLVSDSTSLSFFVINWYGMIGITASIVVLCWNPFKLNFLISCGIKMLMMVLFLSTMAIKNDLESFKITMTFVFIVLGFGYGYCDINILSYTNLKYNELILAVGYSVQYITIGVMQYYTIFLPTYVFNFTSVSQLVLSHSLVLAALFTFVGILAIFLLPNRNQISLLEIKNAMIRKPNLTHTAQVPVVHPNNDYPPPYMGQPVYPYANHPPGSQATLPQSVVPGTNYPQYYPPPQAYSQHPAQPYYYQQQPPYLAYGGANQVHPERTSPPPNYSEHPPQMAMRSDKVTEL